MSKATGFGLVLIAAIMIGVGFLIFGPVPRPMPVPQQGGQTLRVVAAENFWGSIVSQLGGDHVTVLSIVSDPNADPHEYESTASDARAVATANYVVMNGAGYDSWMNKLIGANPNAERKVLDVSALLGKKPGDNPHFWYSPGYVDQAAARMEQDLAALDPAHAAYYEARYRALQTSFAEYQGRIAAIHEQFGGTQVAATEDIFTYLADAAGLDLVSPPAFMSAVAEGNDPSSASVIAFEDQLRSGQVKVLVYNKQTITPLTDSLRQLAAEQGIPVVAITETIQPPTLSYQDWMNGQVTDLQNALMMRP